MAEWRQGGTPSRDPSVAAPRPGRQREHAAPVHPPRPREAHRARRRRRPCPPRLRLPRAGPRRAPGPAAPGPGRPPPRRDVPSSTHKVTLVTGDVVTLTTMADGHQIADVKRPADAVGGVRMQKRGNDLYVVPDEAVSLLGADRLDPRLFDVTELVADGYDDAGSRQVPTIATYTRAAVRAPGVPSAPEGSTLVRRLPSVRGAALTAAKPEVARSGTPSRPAREPDRPLADAARTASRSCGSTARCTPTCTRACPRSAPPRPGPPGTTARASRSPCSTPASTSTTPTCPHRSSGTKSFVPDEGIADVDGHGTHVASTIVGTGAAQDGYYKGVAPGAKLEVGKVLDNTGSGQDSWVLAGMEWAAAVGRQGRQHEPRRHRRRRTAATPCRRPSTRSPRSTAPSS